MQVPRIYIVLVNEHQLIALLCRAALHGSRTLWKHGSWKHGTSNNLMWLFSRTLLTSVIIPRQRGVNGIRVKCR